MFKTKGGGQRFLNNVKKTAELVGDGIPNHEFLCQVSFSIRVYNYDINLFSFWVLIYLWDLFFLYFIICMICFWGLPYLWDLFL